ncbi:MAG: potassium/proton antiporter [Paludibacteraceae bacterium]|nr:potassium/proton antiporter [Paludibacteraceae bacterium]
MEGYTSEWILFIGSILIFVSILISKTGYKFGVPTLLLFLVVGMCFGEDGLGLKFDSVQDAQFVGMLGMSIILFSGGMDTKLSDIKPILKPGLMLSTFGVVLMTIITGAFIYSLGFIHTRYFDLVKFPLLTAMLLAATMSSTDSASVFNILRSQKINLKHNLKPLLELESGSNDPMAYMLTIVLIQLVSGGGATSLDILVSLIIQFALGGFIGFAVGKFAVFSVNHFSLNNRSLYSILVLAFIFFTFTITDMAKGNGYLAVYLAGIVVGNNKLVNRKDILTFLNGLTWFFQILMFLLLGLLVHPSKMFSVAFPAIFISLFMIFIARPASVFACMLPFYKKFPFRAMHFASFVGLRGAAPIIFATYPVVANIPGSDIIFNIVFFVTLFSLLSQGMTIAPVARMLKLDTPYEEYESEFGIELPDDIDRKLRDKVILEDDLSNGCRIMDIKLDKGTLIILVKRGNKLLTPSGSLELYAGDKLLLIDELQKQ